MGITLRLRYILQKYMEPSGRAQPSSEGSLVSAVGCHGVLTGFIGCLQGFLDFGSISGFRVFTAYSFRVPSCFLFRFDPGTVRCMPEEWGSTGKWIEAATAVAV